MKFKFRQKIDFCKDYQKLQITSKNIIFSNGEFKNYTYEIDKDYFRASKQNHPENLVNTRFTIVRAGVNQNIYYYANLNWIQKFWLKWIRKDHPLQNQKNISILISLLAIIVSIALYWVSASHQRTFDKEVRLIRLEQERLQEKLLKLEQGLKKN